MRRVRRTGASEKVWDFSELAARPSRLRSVLISVRELDRLLILHASMSKVLWVWGKKEVERQHHATQLENGNILLFDNGQRRRRSRVLEVDAARRRIVWQYTAPDFYTAIRGAVQKLPNGNVLATLSDSGHAVELTRDGDKVWEFWNPDVHKEQDRSERAIIYRLTRYSSDYLRRSPLGQTPTEAAGKGLQR